MRTFLILCVVVVVSAKPVIVKDSNPEYGEFFEGDIMTEDGFEDRLAVDSYSMIVGERYKWPGGVVYYQITPGDFDAQQIQMIRDGQADISANTCIRFEESTGTGDYVQVYSGGGCSSYVGRIGGPQTLSLAPGCFRHGTIMHEFLHALGTWHEHTRADRDDYVTIHFDNIVPGAEGNFQRKIEGVSIDHLGTGYDYGSVMHYGRTGFAIDPTRDVITPHDPNAEIGQRLRLSANDATRIKRRYCGGV